MMITPVIPVIYTDFVSTEPLDIIRCNECEYRTETLVTKRFRAFWNEIERLRAIEKRVEKLEKALQPFAKEAENMHDDNKDEDEYLGVILCGEIRAARRALEIGK